MTSRSPARNSSTAARRAEAASEHRGAAPAPERKRVLFVHSATLPPLGADTWVHALLMRYLDRSSAEVHAACAFGRPGEPTPTFDALSVIPGLELSAINLGPELFRRSRLGKVRGLLETAPAVLSVAALLRYVRKHRIQILHTSDRPRDAAVCAALARLTGIKFVIHVHVRYGNWMSPMLRQSMARADAVIGVSEYVRGSLLEAGYSPVKTHAVLNAIDVTAWDHRLDGVAVRRSLSIPPATPVVTCVARIFRDKGQEELIRAMALVRRDFPDTRLLIVGQDYPAGTHHSAELKRLARELGVLENVQFLGQRRDIAALLAATDIYAMPSLGEPFGLVYAEAMAMKRPVIALDEGGAPEVVEHGRSGLLCARGDVAALAENIRQLISDPARRASMGEHGRHVVETLFHPERMARDVMRIYSSL